MKRSPILVAIVVGMAALAGCGSGAKMTAHYTTTPPTTIAGVGVTTSGPPPKPNTPTACAHRWNSAANERGRRAARQQAPRAESAFIQKAGSSGYFRSDAARCLVWLITPPRSAVVFIETAPGRFVSTADATGHFSANAYLQQGGRLRLR